MYYFSQMRGKDFIGYYHKRSNVEKESLAFKKLDFIIKKQIKLGRFY